jgi:hypothetical protein
MPRLDEAALVNKWLHFLEHASFFLTAFIFWQVFADLTQHLQLRRARVWPGDLPGLWNEAGERFPGCAVIGQTSANFMLRTNATAGLH